MKTIYYRIREKCNSVNKDSVSLNNIVKKHVTSLSPDKQINFLTYFKPKKLSSLFSTRRRCEDTAEARVVYKFCCTEERCQSSYIGYTTNALSVRKEHVTIQCSLLNMIPLLKVSTLSIDSLTSLILK